MSDIKETIKDELRRRIFEDYNSGDKERDEAVQGALSSMYYWIDALQENGTSVEAQVIQSYSGRRELFFSNAVDLLAKFKDGQKVKITITPTD